MEKIVFFDTETTGLPIWSEPSDSEAQPHLTQIAALVVDADTRKVLSSIDLTIRPEGWEIPAETVELNQLTTEHCANVGVNEMLAITMFLSLIAGAKNIIAHNSSFDQRIIRIAMKRYGYSDAALIEWADKGQHHCTMLAAHPIMGLKRNGKPKFPSLSEAYEHFIGKPLEGAHTALADARGCMEVYFAMQDLANAKEPVIKF